MSSSSFGAKSRWKLAVEKVQQRLKDEKQLSHLTIRRPEWGRFSFQNLKFLHLLSDKVSLALPEILDQYETDLEVEFRSDSYFMIQCFLASLDGLQNVDKFVILVEFLQGKIDSWQMESPWKKIFPVVFEKAVRLENAELLAELLALAHDSNPPKLGPPWPNNPEFIIACEKNKFDLVNAFMSKGYRLQSRHLTKAKRENVEEANDNWIQKLKKNFKHNSFLEGDEVVDLRILEAMAQPAYVLSCYLYAYDLSGYDAFDPEMKCECPPRRNKTDSGNKFRNASLAGCIRDRMFQDVTNQVPFHFCPYNDKFIPNENCPLHLECNDPIIRCFDIAKVASDFARSVPEYETEYEKIANSVRQLSVDLLDECENTDQVGLLLSQSNGSEKYLRISRSMRFPILRLAIEHNHKEFAGKFLS